MTKRQNRQQEIAAPASAERPDWLELALDAGDLAAWEINLITGDVLPSPRLYKLFGRTPTDESESRDRWRSFVHEDDQDLIRAAVEASAATGCCYHLEYRIRWPDGTVRWHESTGKPLADETGKFTRLVGVVKDVTERKELEEELRLSHERLKLAEESAGVGLWNWHVAEEHHQWTVRMYALLGIDPSIPPSFDAWDRILHPQDKEAAHRSIDEAIAEHKQLDSQFRVIHPDGQVHWINALGRPQYDAQGHFMSMAGICIDITRRKADEEALFHQLREIEAIYEASPAGLAVLDRDLRYVRINHRLAVMNGLPVSEHLGKTIGQVIPKLADQAEAIAERIFSTGEPALDIEMAGYTPAAPQTLRHWTEQWVPLKDEAGNVTAINVSVEEVTARKQAELELRESEARLQEALRVGRSFTFEWCPQTDCVKRSHSCGPILGLAGEEAILDTGQGYFQRIHSEDRLAFISLLKSLAPGNDSYETRYRFVRPDGRITIIDESARGDFDASGNLVRLIGICTDVTVQQKAQEDLRASEERFRSLFENMLDGFAHCRMIYDDQRRPEDFVYLAVNKSFERLTGLKDVTGKKVSQVIPGIRQSNPELLERYGLVASSGNPLRFETYVPQLERWFSIGVYCPEAGCFVAVFDNITSRKRAEESLQQSRSDLDRAQAVGQIGSWRLDIGQDVLKWSDECYRIFGVPKGTAMTYEAFLAIVHPDDRTYVDTQWMAGLRGEPYDIEHRIVVDGTIKWVREKAYLEHDASGALLGGFGIAQDITARKQAQEALREAKEDLERRVDERTAQLQHRSRQLAALASELALTEQRERRRLAQVLHDGLQQLLVGAKFHLGPLERSADPVARKTAARVNELLIESIDTSRSLTAELSPPILYEGGLVAAMEWLARWMQEKHGLAVNLDAEELITDVGEDIAVLLFQATRELLFNVVKHAGTESADVNVTQFADSIRITVSDQGRGFDSKVIETRTGRTGGFGLFSIAERLGLLGGKMEVDSAPGRGSHFTLTAPVKSSAGTESRGVKPPRVSVAIAPMGPADAEGKIRVVLVDDHIVMRQGLVALLREEKDIAVVGEASDGHSAVELVRQVRPDVVLMDITLPGMNGIEATRIIHAEFPQVAVIGLSMFDQAEQANIMRQAGAADYLTKSGPSEALVAAIRQCSLEKKD
ncbi:MAG: PAS domain-containing protein [Planctomycetaceae bacterium]|nr:PAS domain-containing protein [Planctomycetaceae bacterium]